MPVQSHAEEAEAAALRRAVVDETPQVRILPRRHPVDRAVDTEQHRIEVAVARIVRGDSSRAVAGRPRPLRPTVGVELLVRRFLRLCVRRKRKHRHEEVQVPRRHPRILAPAAESGRSDLHDHRQLPLGGLLLREPSVDAPSAQGREADAPDVPVRVGPLRARLDLRVERNLLDLLAALRPERIKVRRTRRRRTQFLRFEADRREPLVLTVLRRRKASEVRPQHQPQESGLRKRTAHRERIPVREIDHVRRRNDVRTEVVKDGRHLARLERHAVRVRHLHDERRGLPAGVHRQRTIRPHLQAKLSRANCGRHRQRQCQCSDDLIHDHRSYVVWAARLFNSLLRAPLAAT